jgi:hypothetical protein
MMEKDKRIQFITSYLLKRRLKSKIKKILVEERQITP